MSSDLTLYYLFYPVRLYWYHLCENDFLELIHMWVKLESSIIWIYSTFDLDNSWHGQNF